jgi:hypothetical protein
MINITDVRDILPRHDYKQWRQRELGDIKGVVFHQSLGHGSLRVANKYHISNDNHISATGCPRLCYTAWVDEAGEVFLCNDLEDITWSQGGRVRPFTWAANTHYVAVCFKGNFTGADHIGSVEPTDTQLAAGIGVWEWLRDLLGLTQMDLFGHYHFGKPACPGDVLGGLVETIRSDGLQEYLPATHQDWQFGLKTLGYDLGNFGPMNDGVDGDWGGLSQKALVNFQRDCQMTATAVKDSLSAQMLAWEVLCLTEPERYSYRSR